MSVTKTIGLPAEGGYVTWEVSAPHYIPQSESNLEIHQSTVRYVDLDQQSYTLIFTLSPADAVLTVNGSEVSGSGNTRTITGLHYGDVVSWVVSRTGYLSLYDEFVIENDMSIIVELDEVYVPHYNVTIVPTPNDAVVMINGSQRTYASLEENSIVDWSVSKEGYITQSGSFTLTSDVTMNIQLQQTPQYTVTINATPFDSIVIINGIQRITATFYEGDVVTWSVNKVGYDGQTGSFIISSNTTLNINLTAMVSQPLTFEVTTGGDIYWMYSGMSALMIEYSVNGGSWTGITAGSTRTAANTISVSSGDIIRFRGNNNAYGADRGGGSGNAASNYFSCYNSNVRFNVYGDITSLIAGDNYESVTSYSSPYTFAHLFGGANVVNANNLVLRVTSLSGHCYQEMFSGCKYLKTIPLLPATTLTEECYKMMFSTCIALNSIGIILPATTLALDCYHSMFNGCSYLYSVPVGLLPATIMAPACYSSMFGGCTRLTNAPNLPSTTLAESCYNNMFVRCTELQIAPDLPATTLVTRCYDFMFRYDSKLTYIKCLATDISAIGCTYAWTEGVSADGLFIKASGMVDWTTGNNGIPAGWTVRAES